MEQWSDLSLFHDNHIGSKSLMDSLRYGKENNQTSNCYYDAYIPSGL